MIKATAGKLLATTLPARCPVPSWYTENLGLKSFLDDGDQPLPRAVRGCVVGLPARAGSGRSRHRHRRRCRFDQGRGRPELYSYPPTTWTASTRRTQAGVGRRRRDHVSARAYSATTSKRASCRQLSARSAAARYSRRDLEGGAALTQEAGEVRHGDAGTGRLLVQDGHYKFAATGSWP
jgi:hypothetical protein